MKKQRKGIVGLLLFALITISALLVVQWYQLVCLASSLREDSYVVNTTEVSQTLKKMEIPEDRVYHLMRVGESEPVYRRGNSYYVGQGKDEFDGAIPLYVNNGNEILIINDKTKLITSDFEKMDTMVGMYISDGMSFNYDRSQADEEEFLFVKTENGLFINAETIEFDYIGGNELLRMNSILNFTENGISYYEVGDNNKLYYGQLTNTKEMTVRIGEHAYSYDQLLHRLGIVKDTNPTTEEGEAGEVPTYEPEPEETETIIGEDELNGSNKSELDDGSVDEDASADKKDKDAGSNGKDTVSGNKVPQEPSKRPNDTADGGGNTEDNNSETGAGSDGKDDGSGGSVVPGGSDGSAENPDEGGGSTDGDASGEGEDVTPKYAKPTASIGEFVPDIYNVTSTISLVDPSYTFKRVAIELYWQDKNADGTAAADSSNKDDYKLNYRKSFKTVGDIKIDNLPPDTVIYAKAYLYYYDENGKTVKEEFYDGFSDRFKTLSLDNVDDLYLQFNETSGTAKLSQHAMSVYDFAISGQNKNVVDKINKIRFNITALDEDGNETEMKYTAYMSMSDASGKHIYPYTDIEAKLPEIEVWTSDAKSTYLPSNTSFVYTIDLLDPFGTPFTHIVDGYMANEVDTEEQSSLQLFEKSGTYYTPMGHIRTAKLTPSISLTSKPFSDGVKNINRNAYDISVTDIDHALTGYEDTYYIKLFDETTNQYVQFATSKDNEADRSTWVNQTSLTEVNLQGTTTRYELWGLTAGHVYRAEVYGNYDLGDNNGVRTEQLLATNRFSTVSMTSYGRVSYIINTEHVKTHTQPDGTVTDELSNYESATAQKVSLSIDYTQTSYDLVNLYYSYLDFSFTNMSNNANVFKGKLTREAMEAITVTGTGTGKTVDLEIPTTALFAECSGSIPTIYLQMTDFEGTSTLWDLFSNYSNNAKFVFYFVEGSLSPVTTYRFDSLTYAYQGGEYHDVTSRVNSFKRADFTTLKRMPYLTYDDALLVSDYIKFTGLHFHDPDHAIVNGRVNAGIISFNTDIQTLDYTADTSGMISELLYKKLVKGKSYTFSVAPELIQRDNQGIYSLTNENLLSYSFVAGSGLQGKIVFNSISYPLSKKDGDDSGAVQLASDYSLYNAGDFAVGTGNIDTTMYYRTVGDIPAGTIIDTGNMSSGNWTISPAIDVVPGEYYYLAGLRPNLTDTSYIMFFDDYGNMVTTNVATWSAEAAVSTHTGTRINRLPTWGDRVVVKIPAGAKKMRFAMYGSKSAIPTYATASCYALSKADGIEQLGADGTTMTVATANSMNEGKGMEVVPGGLYAITGSYNYSYATFRDENGNVVGTWNGRDLAGSDTNVRTGISIYAPANAKYMKVTLSTASGSYTTAANAEIVKVNLDVLAWLETTDYSKFANAVSLTVQDPLNNLVNGNDNKVYLDIAKNGESLTGDDYPLSDSVVAGMYLNKVLDPVTNTYVTQNLMSYYCNFLGDANQHYDLTLYVYYKGEKIILDQVAFNTYYAMEVIDDRTDLAKMMRYQNGNFMVVDDITLRTDEGFYWGRDEYQNSFQGTVDFQGYTLKATTTAVSGYYGIYMIGSSGVIKNLVYDYTMNAFVNKKAMTYNRGLTYINRGTIQNVVVNLNLGQGMYRKNHCSALSEQNQGLIENFTLNYSASSTNYVGTYFGGLVRTNSGTIRNGLVYCPTGLNSTTGIYMGDTTGNTSNAYVGLVCAYGSGVLSNVISVGNVAVEQYTTSGTLPYASLTSGNSDTMVRNCITVGDLMKVTWNDDGSRTARVYTAYGPGVAGSGYNNYSNNYFYSDFGSAYSRKVAGKHQMIQEAALLQDPSLYNMTVNLDGAFNMDDLSMGYYPRVNMPNDLIDAQPKVSLASMGVDNSIRFMTATVDEQYEIGEPIPDEYGNQQYDQEGNLIVATEDYAILSLRFSNRLERIINDITIDGLIVTPVSGDEYEQETIDGSYYVKVKVTPDGLYRDSYPITRFVYNGNYVSTISDREVVVKFSKAVNQDNWIDENGKTFLTDLEGSYRLTSDIDYEAFSDSQKAAAATAMYSNSNFKGTIDGRNHKIENFELTKYPSFMKTIDGATIKNVIFENTRINDTSANNAYSGIIAIAQNDAMLKDITIRNEEITGIYQYAGGLVAYANRITIEDCVVNGLKMTSDTDAKSIYAGGLIGRLLYTNVSNCFVRNISMEIKQGQDAAGIGGFTGSNEANSYIKNVYAQGSIDSSFIRTGGLVGYNNALLLQGWSKVGIASTAPYVAGISGIQDGSSNVSNMIAFGQVFTTAVDNYNRINGGFLATKTPMVRTYAAEAQKMNSIVEPDNLYDAVGLISDDNLKIQQYYYNTANIGEEFDYSQVSNGYIPFIYDTEAVDEYGNRKLLPEQTVPIEAVSEDLDYTAEGVATYTISNLNTAHPYKSNDPTTWEDAYDGYAFEVKVTVNSSELGNAEQYAVNYARYFGEEYQNISVENLNLNVTKDANGVITNPTVSYKEDGTGAVLTYTGVSAQKLFDSYRIVIIKDGNKEGQPLAFKQNGTDTELYHHIFRAKSNLALKNADGYDVNSWEDAMKLYGMSNENFMIMADLDFSTMDKSNYTMNLKIGRLEGGNRFADVENHESAFVDLDAEGVSENARYTYLRKAISAADAASSGMADDSRYYKIMNLTYTETAKSSVYLINTIQTELAHLHFANINWTNTPSSNYVGIIRTITGNAHYVDVDNLTINYGNSTGYIGFVTYTYGSFDYVRGRDIKISTTNSSPTRNVQYVGGLLAYTYNEVKHIHIRGSNAGTADAPESGYSIQGQYTNNGTSYTGGYTGGIAGYMSNPGGYYLYAENVKVTGNRHVGGLCGYNYTYYNAYSMFSTTMYNNMQQDVAAGEDPIVLHKVTNVDVTGSYYVGGVYGSAVYIKYANAYSSTINAYQYAGGIAGYHGGNYWNVKGCNVRASSSYAGGLVGSGVDIGYSYSTVTGTNVSAENYAGGIIGTRTNTSTAYVAVKDSAIYANSYVGGLRSGLTGDSYQRSIYNSIVTNCYIGRSNTQYPEAYEDAQSESGYSVRWVSGSGIASDYVGGITGESRGVTYYGMIVDDSVVIAGSNYIGGLFGVGGGGTSYDLEIAPTILATGNYVGTLAGELIGYEEADTGPNILQRPISSFTRVILGGQVTGAGNVGGVAGSYKLGNRPVDPETGAPLADADTGYPTAMSRTNFKQFVLAQSSVDSTSSAKPGLIASNVKQSDTTGIDYLRVYNGLMLKDTVITAVPTAEYLTNGTVSNWVKSTSAVSEPQNMMWVTTANLQDSMFYYGKLENGGLYMSRYNSTNKKVTNWYYYFDTQETNITPDDVTSDAGAGVLKTKSIFPYLNTGGNRTHVMSAYQDGITIPGTAQTMSLIMSMTPLEIEADDIFSQVSIYASGADTVNVEFPAEMFDYFSPTYSLTNADGVSIVKETAVPSRTLTIPYDYMTNGTLRLKLNEEDAMSFYIGSDAANTVMTYGNHAYYIKSDGIYQDKGAYSGDGKSYDNSEKVLSGSFVHLYQGSALDQNGDIYSVTSGEKTGHISGLSAPLAASKPLYTTMYDKAKLETYRMYTTVIDPSGAKMDQAYRIFTKSSQAIAADPWDDAAYGEKFTSFIADYYSANNVEYYSVLDVDNAVVVDYMTNIVWPVNEKKEKILKNYEVESIADNVMADVPYITIRYYDNTVACFNYQTGSLLFYDESEKQNLEFTSFVSMWVDGYTANLQLSSQYGAANSLISTLASNPIKEDQIVGYYSNEATPEGTGVQANATGTLVNSKVNENGQGDAGEEKPVTENGTSTAVNTELTSTEGNTATQQTLPEQVLATSKSDLEYVEGNETSDSTDEIVNGTGTADTGTIVSETAQGTGTTAGTATVQGTGNEQGTASADGNKSEEAETVEKPESVKAEKAEQTVFPSDTSKSAYITVISSSGGAEVFKVQDLLTKSSTSLLSENRKIQLLKEQGMYSSFDLSSLKIDDDTNKTGMTLVLTTVAVMTLLVGVLYWRKKLLNKR